MKEKSVIGGHHTNQQNTLANTGLSFKNPVTANEDTRSFNM